MSKIIKMTQQNLEEIMQDFANTMKAAKLSDGKVSYTKTFGTVDRKAELFFTEMAYLKMLTLVREFDKEVAWHGVAYRDEDPNKDAYYITDILVYPQEVTGATVNTDQEKYQMWLMQHEDDVFNNIRMQGHSHVNMATNPSTVDTSLYERILDQLDEGMFYIFLIWNKRGDKTIKIYDMEKNILFETADVTVKIQEDGSGIEKFLSDAKAMVQDKKVTYGGNTTYGGTGYNYGGYSGGYGGYYQNGKQVPATSGASTKKEEPKTTYGSQVGKPSKSKKHKKKKGGGSKNFTNAADPDCWLGGSQPKSTSSSYPYGGSSYWDDEDDDGYSYYSRGWD